MISAIAAAGVFVAVPITGAVALGRGPIQEGMAGRVPLVVAVGMTLWSIPLLGSLILQIYRPEVIGLLGWAVVAAWLVVRRPRLPTRLRLPRLQRHAIVLAVGLLAAGILYAAAPSEPVAGGRDMAVYANHAIYMVHHGRLDVPYPDGLGTGQSLPEGWVGFSGVYTTEPTLTVQFGHVFPAWLAQTFAVFGYGGLMRFNAVMAVISGLAIFAVARRWMPPHVAVLATLFLAFSAGQVWVTRNTLTEILTQLSAWTVFLLLLSQRQERPRAAAAWAGVLLGMSALVRIDSLVILPLVVIGHAVVRLVREPRDRDLPIAPFYATAIPGVVLAVIYYIGWSNPYFIGHATFLWPIAGALIVGCVLLAITFVPRFQHRAEALLTDNRFLWVASALVIGVAVFAYFVRPHLPPFERLPREGPLPPRSQVEDAMWNLGLYLSPVVLWMGVAGWLARIVAAVRQRVVRPIPVLVIVGGFSALYFWNQAITPDHFWAIRRFVPIILPAAIVLAGVAGSFVLARMPHRWRAAAFAVAALALSAQSLRAGWPMYAVAERAGIYAALERFASELPRDQTYLGPFGKKAMHTVGTALFLSFDHEIVPVAWDGVGGRDELIERLRTVSPENPVPIISERRDDRGVLLGETIGEVYDSYDQMISTVEPVPQAILDGELDLVAKRVTGINILNLDMGPRSHWLIEQDGFLPPEPIDDHEARWTMGNAWLKVPIFDNADPAQLVIDLEWTGPLGASVVISYDGEVLFSGDLPEGGWRATLDLPPDAALRGDDDEAVIRIRSSTFTPADVLEGSRDTRELGVMVRTIQLLGPTG